MPGVLVSGTKEYLNYSNNAHPQWWRDGGLRKANFFIVCYMIAQCTGGYDKSLLNNLQSMPAWEGTMQNPRGGTLGIITASLSLGVVAGSPFFAWLADKRGRKITMFIGALIMFVGAVLQAAADGRKEFIAGRALIGFGVAGTLCSGPLLAAEIAHPRQRAVIVSFYNTFWYVGSIICAWLSFGTAFLSTNASWRIPAGGQALPALFVCAVCYWLPESPRWLIKNGRAEEALNILAKYHANGDKDDKLVQFEMEEITAALQAEDAIPSRGYFLDWYELVRTPANRYRMFIITMLVIGIDWCGTAITSYYLSSILTSVGITSATQQTGVNGGLQIFNWLTSIAGAMMTEVLGRRKLWLLSFGSMLAVNIPFGACSYLYASNGNKKAGQFVIAASFLYSGAYNLACNPLPYTYTVEILPYAIRSKGLAFEVAWDAANGVLGQYTTPLGLDALAWKFYFVFTAFLVMTCIIIYLYFPETAGLTMEEVSEVFGDAPDKLEAVHHRGGDVSADTASDEKQMA